MEPGQAVLVLAIGYQLAKAAERLPPEDRKPIVDCG